MTEPDKLLTPWSQLDDATRLALRRDYQAELDRQPLTCSLDEKLARFTQWLESRGVGFTGEDLKRR